MQSILQNLIRQKLSAHFTHAEDLNVSSISGGSINQTFRIRFATNTVFCKINSATKFPFLFLKEKSGLEIIRKQDIIKTPAVIDCFEYSGSQILLLEWIEEEQRTDNFWKIFGKQLAALHQTSNDSFGLDEDNYMGSVSQPNNPQAGWVDFFISQRLQPMIKSCAEKGLLTSNDHQKFEKLFFQLPEIFGSDEKPSLLHGDLWSGNFMCNQNSEPVLIDPAVYYGHRSMDLAMTTLFGGFDRSFYDAYHYHFPFPKNYKEQWQVANLYPLLIHLCLFGPGYLRQIQLTLQRFS